MLPLLLPDTPVFLDLHAGPRTQECLEAAMEALSGVNNIGSYTSFRSVSIANYDAYSSFTIIGGHVFY